MRPAANSFSAMQHAVERNLYDLATSQAMLWSPANVMLGYIISIISE